MIFNCCESIKFDIECQKRLLNRLYHRLEQLDYIGDEFLKLKYCSGRPYYWKCKWENGLCSQEYLRKESAGYRREIQEKRYIIKAIGLCEKNIAVLTKALEKYKTIDPLAVAESLPRAYREQENAMKLVFGYEKSSKWREKKLNEKKRFIDKYGDYMEAKRGHTSSDGVLINSKSEIAMNELLLSMGIPFVYEFPRFFGDKIKRPDFLCLNERTGKEYFFEHVGYLADEKYAMGFVEKMRIYARAGVIPNVNLLLTFEDSKGNIDLQAARAMLETFLK